MSKHTDTTLTRITTKSLNLIRQLAKAEDMTLTQTLDYVIKKFFKNNKFYFD